MLAAIPVWVPAIFLGLLALGYRQSLTRSVRPVALVASALAMLGLSLFGVVSAFGAQLLPLLMWAAGVMAALSIGRPLLAAQGLRVVGDRVLVPGSWVPMALLLGIFAAKFLLGFAAGVHAPVLQQAWFAAAMSLLLGALSGGLGARAWAVQRCARGAGHAPAMAA